MKFLITSKRCLLSVDDMDAASLTAEKLHPFCTWVSSKTSSTNLSSRRKF